MAKFENAVGVVATLFIGALWLLGIAVSVAVPVAIVWATYHFITTYKG
jgi:hypothetical protein